MKRIAISESTNLCVHGSQHFEVEALTTVNSELAQRTITDTLTDKLSQLSIRNINKKIRRRDKNLDEARCQVLLLQEEV